jgi:hypothetical protein
VWNRWREAAEWRLRESGRPVWVNTVKNNQAGRGAMAKILDFLDTLLPWLTRESISFTYGSGFMMGQGLGYGNHPHHLNLEALSWKQVCTQFPFSFFFFFFATSFRDMLTDVLAGSRG